MKSIFYKTLGGLTPSYYLRQFAFGSIFLAISIWASINSTKDTAVIAYVYFALSTLLYPYSRFVYESVMGFIIGNNTFYLNAIMMLIFKFMTMAICWFFAVFIAPFGLAYLYFHHSKRETSI